MIDPNVLFEKIVEATDSIGAINTRKVVVTDDEFVEFLTDFRSTDNLLLVAVLPSYQGGGEEDERSATSFMQFFILKKVDYKGFKNQGEYLGVFQETLAAAKLFLQKFFEQGGYCGGDTIQPNWNMRPVSRKAQCNGYEIQLDARSYADFIE